MTTPNPAAATPTLSFGYGDYLRFSQLVLDQFGLRFPEKRRADLEMGVRQAFAASTCTDLDEYYQLLLDPHHGALEMDRLVNALTVNETYFFRDAGQFDALYHKVLPQIIQRRRPLRTLRIWSAGCATGEEPYSIAMMLRDLISDIDQWSITILGTDINTEALDRARKAVYGDWSFREERAKLWRPRYFRKQDKRYELIPEVTHMVTFDWLNLAEDQYPTYKTNTTVMDLIMCRNVTIYFSQPVINKVVERLYDSIVDDGWLVVGHSETSPITYRRFQARSFPNAILYQRTGKPTSLPIDWEWLTSGSEAGELPKPLPPSRFPSRPPTRVPPIATSPPMTPPKIQPTIGSSPAASSAAAPTSAEPEPGNPLEEAQKLLDFGRSEEARDVLLDLIEAKPSHAEACVLLGQAYANLGYWQESEQWCRQALQLNKLSLKAYYTLALVLQHQERLEEAIDAMKKVVYIDHNSIVGHFGLADLYRTTNQLPQALKSLDNARRLLENLPDADLVPDSGGITTARLREAIIHQQQRWGIGQ